MGAVRTILLSFSTFACLPALLAYGQNGPSLGDIARQARQQKPQSDGPNQEGRALKPVKVISEEDIPEHAGDPARLSNPDDKSRPLSDSTSTSKDAKGAKTSAEQWKSRILAQKQLIKSMQNDIDQLEGSIRFSQGKSSSKTERWNERQKEKLQEVEQTRHRLEDQKKRLEDMQESARQQGYGNAVYDP